MVVLDSTESGKKQMTLLSTYKDVIRPILDYASTIWSHIESTTNITKLLTIQNTTLRVVTGYILDINIQHLHDETNHIIPHMHTPISYKAYYIQTKESSYIQQLHIHHTHQNTQTCHIK